MSFKILFLSATIFLLAFISFTYSVRFFNTTDSYPNNFTAFNLIFYRRLDLTNLAPLISERGIVNTTVKNSRGEVFAKTPPLLGILSVPTFSFLDYYFGVTYLTPHQIVFSDYGQYIGKISAAFYCSLSAVLLYLILRKLNRHNFVNLLATGSYVFGTSVFNTAAQANWQHGISLFLIMVFIYVFISHTTGRLGLFVGGLVLGLLTQIRISNLFYILLPISYVVFGVKAKKTVVNLLILFFGFGLVYFSISFFYAYLHIPYGYAGEITDSLRGWSPVSSLGIVGSLLISPNAGLFVFSPILVLAIPSMLRVTNKLVYFMLPTLVAYFIFLSVWKYWLGGTSLEARLLIETLPIWVIFLQESIIKYWKNFSFKGVFALLFGTSIFINILTTFFMNWWWFPLYTKGTASSQLRDAWFTHPTLVAYILKTRFFQREILYRDKHQLMISSIIYRFDVKSKSVDKICDKTYPILNLN